MNMTLYVVPFTSYFCFSSEDYLLSIHLTPVFTYIPPKAYHKVRPTLDPRLRRPQSGTVHFEPLLELEMWQTRPDSHRSSGN